ncbi:glycine-rich domain-containing protein [Clostridium sp. AM58-1XD]|uniref:glycine-rich domain-containing protein n=1 Tax=Clostridium sp. AM58-1XD TaxID=2292307 RepID=UPI000E46EA08|nr:hypothetical protein [Clostridium sp. AM58-1XD]RGY95370.1 hypothetical protein DXA13_19310 [Clostridium sp. AM58-1XD]
MATFTNAGGGGGLDTDELTATAGDILKGKTAGVKGSDEPVAGTLELTGDAADSTVLSGKTYYNTDAKTKRTGTMANQGAKTAALNCGGSYTIPAGYHNGAGKVTANSLASQTGGATAEDKYVYTGKTYWKDGVKRTGSMTVSSVVSFSVAAYSATQFTCTWKWPSKGPYSGVIIRGKLGGYPTNAWDGQLAYQGTGSNAALGATSSVVISGAQEGSGGTTYYFRIWVYCTCSAGDVYSGYLQTTAATRGRGQQIFTSSGTFTVPANTSFIDVFCVGGGGGGSSSTQKGESKYEIYGGGGGGGGYTTTRRSIAVSYGQQFQITIGAGGSGASRGEKGKAGGGSSFSDLCSANGGLGAHERYPSGYYHAKYGGKGGSGGAGGYTNDGSSDGNSAYIYNNNPSSDYSATGQGSNTRAFSESSGTLYSGGGGTGAAWNQVKGEGRNSGYGGDGGGATTPGNIVDSPGVNAANNTGGGGSGGSIYVDRHGRVYGSSSSGGSGGSGIVIVRWGY